MLANFFCDAHQFAWKSLELVINLKYWGYLNQNVMFVKHRKMVKYLKFRISKLHLQLKLLLEIAYSFITFLNKFLPARLLGPTRLLDVTTTVRAPLWPAVCILFTQFLKFIYVLWPLALCMVSIQERFLIKSGL